MSEKKKRRSPTLAAILNFLAPGLGFLYVGNLELAIVTPCALILIFTLSGWTRLIFNPIGFYLTFLILIVIWGGSFYLVDRIARSSHEAMLHRYQRWYVYAFYFLTLVAINELIITNRASVIGYESFRIPARSMSATLLDNDFFVSNAWAYRATSPKRGEIVVFLFPADPNIKYVKRVIGIPGDVVEMKDGVIYVNGTKQSEPYVNSENNVVTAKWNKRYDVPEDCFFVLGDNRDHSNDSRYWGFVPKDHLHGNVEFIWFSYNRPLRIRFDRIGMQVH
jgi:signal peptidase I